MEPSSPIERRRQLRRLVQGLQEQLATASAEFSALAPGEALPGLHLLLEVEGYRVLIPGAAVSEVVRILSCQPLPGAPQHFLGVFLLRGRPVLAVDLGGCLGRPREPALDSQLVVLASVPTVALRVDRVLAVVDSPVLVEGSAPSEQAVWAQAGLMGGLCRVEQQLVPLLNPSRLLQEAAGWVG